MQSHFRKSALGAGAALALLVGPARVEAAPLHPAAETITYSSGACFSGCPVQRVVLRPDGRVTIRSGSRGAPATRIVDPAIYRELAASLRPYRPATGTVAQTGCTRRNIDEAHYRISWIGRGSITTLDHDYGCGSPSNAVLSGILVEISNRLGVSDAMSGTPATITTKPALPKPHIFYF